MARPESCWCAGERWVACSCTQDARLHPGVCTLSAACWLERGPGAHSLHVDESHAACCRLTRTPLLLGCIAKTYRRANEDAARKPMTMPTRTVRTMRRDFCGCQPLSVHPQDRTPLCDWPTHAQHGTNAKMSVACKAMLTTTHPWGAQPGNRIRLGAFSTRSTLAAASVECLGRQSEPTAEARWARL